MTISARNVLKGVIKSIDIGAVNVELAVEVAPGLTIASVITKKAFENLELAVGKEAYAVIKASNVMIGTEWQGFTTCKVKIWKYSMKCRSCFGSRTRKAGACGVIELFPGLLRRTLSEKPTTI